MQGTLLYIFYGKYIVLEDLKTQAKKIAHLFFTTTIVEVVQKMSFKPPCLRVPSDSSVTQNDKQQKAPRTAMTMAMVVPLFHREPRVILQSTMVQIRRQGTSLPIAANKSKSRPVIYIR